MPQIISDAIGGDRANRKGFGTGQRHAGLSGAVCGGVPVIFGCTGGVRVGSVGVIDGGTSVSFCLPPCISPHIQDVGRREGDDACGDEGGGGGDDDGDRIGEGPPKHAGPLPDIGETGRETLTATRQGLGTVCAAVLGR